MTQPDPTTVTYDLTGTYDPCQGCRAPVVVPFPPDWTVGLRKDATGVRITPHRPDCPTKYADAPSGSTQPADVETWRQPW